MKMTLTESDFLRAWAGSSRADQFPRDALRAMFEYLEDLERDTGEEMELDIIALCCDWTAWDTAREAATEYGYDPEEQEEDETADDYAQRVEDGALEWLNDETHVIEYDGGILVLNF